MVLYASPVNRTASSATAELSIAVDLRVDGTHFRENGGALTSGDGRARTDPSGCHRRLFWGRLSQSSCWRLGIGDYSSSRTDARQYTGRVQSLAWSSSTAVPLTSSTIPAMIMRSSTPQFGELTLPQISGAPAPIGVTPAPTELPAVSRIGRCSRADFSAPAAMSGSHRSSCRQKHRT